jgi:hypothetical protein
MTQLRHWSPICCDAQPEPLPNVIALSLAVASALRGKLETCYDLIAARKALAVRQPADKVPNETT